MSGIEQGLRLKAFNEFVTQFSPTGGGGGGGYSNPAITTQVYLNGGSSYTVPVGYKAKINFGTSRYRTESGGYNYLYINYSPILWFVSGCDDNAGGPVDSYLNSMNIENLYLMSGHIVKGHGITAMIELYVV